ncbi:hypothetical protein TWF694_004929 [Orbilia ellipsospora]|uniref:DNA replication factor Cdt1 C-terminal domain-containing protein n=1 Tax=Orbilia ellipsospora TaxID=2528407 RepID=A0AAV9WWK1_9PEZI
MGRPKKSAASTAKTLRSSKSTSALKNAATSSTPALVFKSSKITRWSEKKKTEDGGVSSVTVKVDVESTAVVKVDEEVAGKKSQESKTKSSIPVTPRKKKRGIEEEEEDSVTPVTKRVKSNGPSDEDAATITTPSKPESFSSDITVSAPPPTPLSTSITSDTSTAVTESNEQDSRKPLVLPKRIARLAAIHSSIISLLLVHYATHSHSQPAILSEYLTQISRNAGTNVSLVDLQRVTTLSQKTIRLILVEGRGNAIELVNGVSGNISNLGPQFKTRVEKWWKEISTDKDEGEALDEIELAAILPQKSPHANLTPPVTPSKPIKTIQPLSKGQRRLLDLKSFTLTKQTSLSPSPVKKQENILSPSNSPSLSSRNSSLLERIRAKAQAAKSAAPPPPPEVQKRRTALQWLEAIIPILLQLTTPASTDILGKNKKTKLTVPSTTSYPMSTIVQNVKTSLQKPISRQEVEASLRVLADEVASEFVKIVEWKGDSTGNPLVGVVFDRNGRHKVENWKYVEEDSV